MCQQHEIEKFWFKLLFHESLSIFFLSLSLPTHILAVGKWHIREIICKFNRRPYEEKQL